ncbi:MAG TPA: TetR/AcrR family transcriptional regulator [Aquihabitans sp.]|nr:TetR/AcrR family transcriptional regulator [Aquihabitans sp.]
MPSATYHHGDLPAALRGAAAELLAERGAAGFSLREVARRAGVSHAAPTHHFGDSTGLLTAVAAEGFMHLTLATRAATAEAADPVDRLRALGRAYVRVAVEHPGHCAVMFRSDLVHDGDPDVQTWAMQAYDVLRAGVRDVLALRRTELDVEVACRTCWSAMQGLVALHRTFEHIDAGEGRSTPDIGDLAERFTTLIVDGIVGGGTDAPGR